MPKPDRLADYDELSLPEKIHRLQELWDELAVDAGVLPIPPEHHAVLEQRLEDLESNPDATRPWAEVKQRILSELNASKP